MAVSPRMRPDTTETAPNSPIARAVQRITPLTSAHLTLGSVTRRNICQPFAPSKLAASSSSRPDASMTAMSSRATNGNETKIVASTMPGTAKMILMSRSNSHGPNHPCLPKSCTKISPATTGDTANGRSISVVSSRLPRKSNSGDRPRGGNAEDRIGGHRQRGDEERQPDRRQRLGRLDRLHVRLPPIAQRLDEEEDEWNEEKQEQKSEREHRQRDANDAGFGQPRSGLARDLGRQTPSKLPPPEIKSAVVAGSRLNRSSADDQAAAGSEKRAAHRSPVQSSVHQSRPWLNTPTASRSSPGAR